MDAVVHFELPAENTARAKEFYTKVFGWKMMDMPEMNYTMVHTGACDEKGMMEKTNMINGGMMKKDEGTPYPILVINSENLDESLAKVESEGCKVVLPKMQVGDMGWYARFVDPEGNIIGLWQNAVKA
jgi:predicted enzyme related to lactoylglutathione lyase